MVDIAGSYDEQAEAQGEFEDVPPGDYRAKIIEAEIADVSPKSDMGRCLKLTWQIEGGPLDNRLIWQRLNLWAKNMSNLETVINIANSQFASIRQACGKAIVKDTDELLHVPCMLRYGKQKKNPEYSEVKSVKAVDGAGGQAQRFTPPANTGAPQRQAPATSGNGWPAKRSA